MFEEVRAVIHRHHIFYQIKVESKLSDDYFLFHYYRVPLSGVPDCMTIATGLWIVLGSYHNCAPTTTNLNQ